MRGFIYFRDSIVSMTCIFRQQNKNIFVQVENKYAGRYIG